MTPRSATSITDYLAQLPVERRKEMEKVRRVIRRNLPAGYKETSAYGMIAYVVPLAKYADTYNKQPLCYAALAAQKNYLSLYLMSVYGSAPLAKKLRDGFKAAGKKLDMGKSCIRFRTAADLDLETIGEIVASMPLARWVALAKAVRRR